MSGFSYLLFQVCIKQIRYYYSITVTCIDSPSCTGNFLNRSALKQGALNVNINNVSIRDLQHLFPNITFTCNGSITKWIVGAEADTGELLFPELQIWRNTGESSYTKAKFSILSTSTPDSNNIAEYNLSTPLEFQEGDILGMHQPRDSMHRALVVYYQERDGPVNYEEGNSALSTVTLETSHNRYDYPLVTVEISTGKIMPCNVHYNDCTSLSCKHYYTLNPQLIFHL